MIQRIEFKNHPIHLFTLGKRMLVGAWIGLLLICVFLIFVNEPNPEWGKLWWVRPLVIVPMAGAAGGFCNYFILYFASKIGVNKSFAILLSLLVFIIGFYLGFVLGLAGTMWH
ncbi:potassium transporter KefB [Pontibacter sp. KCTC 32443]|uniref:potassium transporter KefB n=1 Tax=Pontibacter TaxID=323449 RepID=UPI00164DE207|nr:MULTISPECIES: potassium transporter KefB [Pontibacter]MBC5772882.1 potassium transporter KefB [Pontibacter sp. KCTC 32443]